MGNDILEEKWNQNVKKNVDKEKERRRRGDRERENEIAVILPKVFPGLVLGRQQF